MVGSVIQREMSKMEGRLQTPGVINETLSNITATQPHVNPMKLGLAMSVTFLAGFMQV